MVAMVAIGLILANLQVAVLLFAGIIILLTVIGFAVPHPHAFIFSLPPITESELDEIAPEIQAQPYPQLFVFSAEIRNLTLLTISPLYSLGLAAFIYSRADLKWAGTFEWDSFPGPFLKQLAGFVTGAAVFLAWTWVNERVLLRRSSMRLGIVHSKMGDGEWSYEYLDLNKERRGGTAFPFSPITHRLMPVFVDSKRGDWSKPGFGFLFHRFDLRETRHLPEGVSQIVIRS